MEERTEKPDPRGVGTITPKYSISPFSSESGGGDGGRGGVGRVERGLYKNASGVE